MIFFVTGANGSGKTSILPLLRERFLDIAWYDMDDAPVLPRGGTVWRQRATTHWIDVALEHQADERDTGVSGHALLGEILACARAPELDGIAACLLDCEEVVRVDRLRARGTHGADQHTLNWAAWQRMHAVDPQWDIELIQAEDDGDLDWARCAEWTRGDPRWDVAVIDTTELSIQASADHVGLWVENQIRLKTAGTLPLSAEWWGTLADGRYSERTVCSQTRPRDLV